MITRFGEDSAIMKYERRWWPVINKYNWCNQITQVHIYIMSTFFLIFSPLKYNPSVWCWLSKKSLLCYLKSELLLAQCSKFYFLPSCQENCVQTSEWAKEGGGQRLLISVRMVVEFHSVACKIQLKNECPIFDTL